MVGFFAFYVQYHIVHTSRFSVCFFRSLKTFSHSSNPKILWQVRIFTSDSDADQVQELEGHRGFINQVAFDASGEFLGSVSDDCTARIWDSGAGTQLRCIRLDSAGVALSWHPLHDRSQEEARGLQLMVAENRGVILFFEKNLKHPLLSLQTPDSQRLSSAAWSATNPRLVGSLADGMWCVWNRELSSIPRTGPSLTEGNGLFSWSSTADNVFVVTGKGCLQMFYVSPAHETHCIQTVEGHASSATWCCTSPICVVAFGATLRILSSEM